MGSAVSSSGSIGDVEHVFLRRFETEVSRGKIRARAVTSEKIVKKTATRSSLYEGLRCLFGILLPVFRMEEIMTLDLFFRAKGETRYPLLKAIFSSYSRTTTEMEELAEAIRSSKNGTEKFVENVKSAYELFKAEYSNWGEINKSGSDYLDLEPTDIAERIATCGRLAVQCGSQDPILAGSKPANTFIIKYMLSELKNIPAKAFRRLGAIDRQSCFTFLIFMRDGGYTDVNIAIRANVRDPNKMEVFVGAPGAQFPPGCVKVPMAEW
ncbi:MAG: hypothetical protein LBF24_02090 [Puniceicoccales bacterium]|jgi:hypothetical protein|nr:hypothetical protein [Puniceicoccales bacterium]